MFILFDLDDTLINSSKSYKDAMLSIAVDPLLMKEARRLAKLKIGDESPSSHNRLIYFKNYLELTNEFTPAACLEISSRYEEQLIFHLRKNTDLNHLDKDLSALKKAGHRMGIVTNETLRAQLLKCGLISKFETYFDFILTSEELDSEKPSFKIFNAALHRWNAKPEQVAMVGDSAENDLYPASELGMKCFGLCTYRDESLLHPSFTWLKLLSELEPRLRAPHSESN